MIGSPGEIINMKAFIIVFCSMVIIVAGCSTEPQALEYGKDQCHSCKMILMDHRFGAEAITKKGKIYKFDDINCLMQFYKGGTVAPDGFAHLLVIDFLKPDKLIKAEEAIYLQSPEIKSPMASQTIAVGSSEDVKGVTSQWNVRSFMWDDIKNKFGK